MLYWDNGCESTFTLNCVQYWYADSDSCIFYRMNTHETGRTFGPETERTVRMPMLRPLFVVFYIYSAWALLAVMTGSLNESPKRIARKGRIKWIACQKLAILRFDNLTFVTFKPTDIWWNSWDVSTTFGFRFVSRCRQWEHDCHSRPDAKGRWATWGAMWTAIEDDQDDQAWAIFPNI